MQSDPLTMEETSYLSQRSFEIVRGRPRIDTVFPYLLLQGEQTFLENSEIEYRHTRHSKTGTSNICHPSCKEQDTLVMIIEKIIARDKGFDGKTFTTSKNVPIKIFVVDSAWDNVAQTLVDKYRKNQMVEQP